MKDYECAYLSLQRIVKDGIPFNVAIKTTMGKDASPVLKSETYAVCGSVLRHYYVFKEIITEQYGSLDEDKFLLLALGIGNKLFAKRIDQNKLNQFIVKKTGLIGAPVFIECFKDPKSLIPERIPYGSDEYYRLRYNIPTWVIKLWQKDGGDIISKQLFHSLTNRVDNLVRVNEYLIETGDFLEKYPDFARLNDKTGIAQYTKEGSMRNHKALLSGDAIRIPISYRKMCKHLELNQEEGIAIYGCGSNHLLEELIARFGNNVKATYICGHAGHAIEIKDLVKQYGLRDVSVYEEDYTNLGKVLTDPVKTLFVCPRSTFFLGLYERADHFLRIKKDILPSLLETEYNSLSEASKYVQKGGNLVYYVTTYNNDECHKMISHFLKEHKDYELIHEKQMFPFDKYQTMLFFAVLKKK